MLMIQAFHTTGYPHKSSRFFPVNEDTLPKQACIQFKLPLNTTVKRETFNSVLGDTVIRRTINKSDPVP